MTAGRPLKFNTEKEYVEYLKLNADKWVKDFFNEEISKIEINRCLQFRGFGANKPSIDIWIETKSGKIIGIECKNPKQKFHELSRAVSQLLSYAVLAEENNQKIDILALFSSEMNDIVHKIIHKYKLPIRNFYIDRKMHGEIE
jgi:hypothetical protein